MVSTCLEISNTWIMLREYLKTYLLGLLLYLDTSYFSQIEKLYQGVSSRFNSSPSHRFQLWAFQYCNSVFSRLWVFKNPINKKGAGTRISLYEWDHCEIRFHTTPYRKMSLSIKNVWYELRTAIKHLWCILERWPSWSRLSNYEVPHNIAAQRGTRWLKR